MINIIASICLLYIFAFVFIGLDKLFDIIYDFLDVLLNGKKPYVTRSSGDVFKDLENSKVRNIYLNVYRFFLHIIESPSYYYYEIKYFIQRGIRGWSNRDSWSIDWYLTSILVPILKKLKENKHGHPMQVYPKDCKLDKYGNPIKEEEKKAIQRWNYILNIIIKTFETTQKIQVDHWFYQNSNKYSNKLANKYRKINKTLKQKRPNLYNSNDLHVMTKEECIKYEEGWKYFQKYYFNLWD